MHEKQSRWPSIARQKVVHEAQTLINVAKSDYLSKPKNDIITAKKKNKQRSWLSDSSTYSSSRGSVTKRRGSTRLHDKADRQRFTVI